MKRLIIILVGAFFVVHSGYAQFTLTATVPATTDVCYAYGNFNSWNVSSTPMTYVSTNGTTKVFTVNLSLAFLSTGSFRIMAGPFSWAEQMDTQFTAATSGTSQSVTVNAFNAILYYLTVNVTVPATLTNCWIIGEFGWTLPGNAVQMSLTTTNADTKVFTYTYASNSTHAFTGKFLSALNGSSYTYAQKEAADFTYAGSVNSVNFNCLSFFPSDVVATAQISTMAPGLAGFSYLSGNGPSSEHSFSVSALNLSSNLTLTPPADYEISTGTGGSFVPTNPITLTKDGSGTIASTLIYVRLKAGLSANGYNAENIVCASSGASSQNVICGGAVYSVHNFSTAEIVSGLGLTAYSNVRVQTGGVLTVDANKTIHTLNVEPNAKLDLSTNLLTVTDLVLEAGKSTAPSLSVTHFMSVTGTMKLQKTVDNTMWYFVSFPCDVTVNSIAQVSGSGTVNTASLGTNWWIRYYDGSSRASNLGVSTNWKDMTAGQTLTAKKGYIIGLDNTLAGDYVLSFPLNTILVSSAETTKTATVGLYGEGSVAASHVGWNLVGIPYLSKFDGAGVGANYLTIFNGSSYDQFAKASVGRYLNPFESFFIQASLNGTTTALSFSTASRQLAPSLVDIDTSDKLQLNLTNTTGTDYTNLIIDESHSSAYEVNQDLGKWLTTGTTKPQIYTLLDGVNYAFNALPLESVRNLPLGIYSNVTGFTTISADVTQASCVSQLLLTDNDNGSITDLLTTNYTFTSKTGTDNTRFTITAERVATEKALDALDAKITMSILNGKLLVRNLPEKAVLQVNDLLGRMLINKVNCGGSLEMTLPKNGIYTVNVQVLGKCVVRRLIKNGY